MVQYRGSLMPLVPIEGQPPGTGARQRVLVFTDRNRSMGLLVGDSADIVEEKLHIDLSSKRPGYLGTSIIAGKATDIIDAGHYLSSAGNDWFNVEQDGAFEGGRNKRVLLVDDSRFFLNLIKPLLVVAGYDVTAVESASEALKLQDSGVEFNAIISDIEMPGMNGFDFVKAIRGCGAWAGVPVIAMSSHATLADVHRGREAGFTDHIAKHNREALLGFLAQHCNPQAPPQMQPDLQEARA